MIWHLTLPVQGRLQAFRSEAELRIAARTIARVVGARLLSWGLPGDHLHALLEGTRAEVGRLGRDLRFALRAVGIHLDEPHYRLVDGRDHLENTVVYHLRQARKHDSCDRPALFSGGCFLDLVGARLLKGYDPGRLLVHLPRFDVAQHLHEVCARALPVRISESEVRAYGASRLVAASGAALAVGPPLTGNTPPVVAARRVAAALGTDAGIPTSELAFSIGCTPFAVVRLARAPRDTRLEHAVRVRLGLEDVAVARVVPEASARSPR